MRGPQYIFRLRCLTTSMLYTRKVDWARRTCFLASTFTGPLGFFFRGYLKSLVYLTPVTLDDLTAQIVIDLADNASIPDKSERVQQSLFSRCRLCNDLQSQLRAIPIKDSYNLLSDVDLM